MLLLHAFEEKLFFLFESSPPTLLANSSLTCHTVGRHKSKWKPYKSYKNVLVGKSIETV